MAGEACMGEEWATEGVGVLALLKAAFVATSEGTATRSASYAEAGTSVGLGGGLLAASPCRTDCRNARQNQLQKGRKGR